ncbi:hypothetical protein [Lysobacter sp. TY2-98]|uniref:hypothetical protein n=1 Tax=Lysobacter sp. TY2-98 TaxID=2290922 RepID=UPI0013B3A770|nr:hypothetical protein [Lysobacter sp. TY2-98]
MRPTRLRWRRFAIGLLAVLALYAGFIVWQRERINRMPTPDMVLLLPADADLRDPLVQVWRDAAAETGTQLRIQRASDFLQPLRTQRRPIAVVMPDSVHRRASPALVSGLQDYVRGGGSLLLTFDAAALSPRGTYDAQNAPLSALVGVEFAMYDRLGMRSTARGAISGTAAAMQALGIPPGKYVDGPHGAELSTYSYGRVNYPHYVTRGAYDGTVLLRAEADGSVVAGVHRAGAGRVMFVNLPVGYLRTRSDGALLHGVLTYFNDEVARLPRLLPTPDGVGGMVLNWHMDSNASYAALDVIEQHTRLLQAGPFSVHITAGPDTYKPGDHAGVGVDTDPRAAAWIARFMREGHAIGSHGGWIHNLFGNGVNERNEAEFSKYLDLNFASLQRATDHPIVEYSAPNGNQPQWVTDWLDRHGVLGYYFTGDTGMAPTHTYRDGHRSDRHTWAFPITTYGAAGSFEEAMEAGIPLPTIRTWLHSVADFTAEQRTARLMYFHPPGVLLYLQPMQEMVDYTRSLGLERFRWYTMADLARFLNRREAVRWSLTAGDRDTEMLDASGDLAQMTWTLPKSRYAQPVVIAGQATVADDGATWLVRSAPGRALRLRLTHVAPPTRP